MIRSLLAGMALLLLAAGPARALELSDVKLDGWKLTVTGQTLTVVPPTIKKGHDDFTLKQGTPGWRGPTLLPGPAWVFEALRPDSLVVTMASDPKTVLTAGKDFQLDPKWAAVAGIPGARGAPGTRVHATYQYAMSRLDLVERTPQGKLVLLQGKEDESEPLLPKATPGDTPVLSVYLANSTQSLSADNINLIDPAYDGVPPVTNDRTLDAVKAKLAAGKPVSIVCLGDSITAQTMKDFRDGKGSYVDRFGAYLKAAYPQSTVDVINYHRPVPAPKDHQILVIKAGVGGDDTPRALRRMDRDVISQKPDVVTVMLGVNDENRNNAGDGNSVPVADYKANLLTIVEKIQAAGAVPVLMTPSMKNLGWSGTVGNMAQYAQAMREVAAAKKVCLVDNYQAWQQVGKRGYNYMILLDTCINHPIDLGHDLFFRGLKAAFEAHNAK